jgi:hypothetical protein
LCCFAGFDSQHLFRDIRDIRDTNILFPQRLFAAFEDEKIGERLLVLRKKCIFVTEYRTIALEMHMQTWGKKASAEVPV